MGLFGSTKVYVSSVVYNMAGDIEGRPDYLKSTVFGAVVGNSKFSMSEMLSSSYLNGPGISIRSFHRWAKRPGKYNLIGIPTARIADESELDPLIVAPHIPRAAGNSVTVNNLRYGVADYSYWSDQYMMNNYLSYFGEAWTSDYNATTNQITIHRADGTTTHVFTPTGFNPNGYYVYATYNERTSSGTWLNTKMWIYEVGTGYTDVDALVGNIDTSDEFLPFIPIRIKNQFLSATYKPTLYAQAKAAYKKLTRGQKLDKLIEMVADNEDIDDIDHAYIVHGVSLNAKDNASRKYIFQFFERMRTGAPSSDMAYYEAYEAATAAYWADYEAWQESRTDWADVHPGEPFPPPPVAPSAIQPTTSVEIKSTGDVDAKLHMIMKWKGIKKTTGTGLGKPGAKVGECWWDPVLYRSGTGFAVELINAILAGSDNDGTDIKIYWQKSATEWEALQILGLVHKNKIYDDKSVEIDAGEALADPDESGFLVPIHYDTMKGMSLIDSTQMMLSSTYLVFNCYKVVKQKWYQTGIFKIVVFVVMIAITVATGGAGAVGLLGTAGGVGAALGFTGLMAVIVGAVANAIAAMLLMAIISKVSVAVFGAKIGAIIGTIASIAAMSVGTSMMNGLSLSAAWGNMMNATNIIGMTSSVGNGVAGMMQASAMQWTGKTEQLVSEYEKASAAIHKQWLKEFGGGDLFFDATQLTDNHTEFPQSFLDRTLMTGSDVADMTLNMLSDFATLTTDVSTIAS